MGAISKKKAAKMTIIEKISKLMVNQQNIRNVVLVAHIDHGKTTLSDSILAAAGILAPSTAGEARALDFLPEEQRRGITMKTANISLAFKRDEEDYLINLIDSPGHVDFSGKVARALRIADGAIVVIDAVEQIMAQTETVIRQCINEGVKPVLFINKIDRLIKELKLTPEEIAERIEIIYNNFNSLVSKFSKNTPVPNWKVTPKDGSVIFGSALHRWAISVPIVKETNITFEEIFDYYNDNKHHILTEILPLHKPLIDLVLKHLPNPILAQKYRIQNIWQGNPESIVGKSMIRCEAKEETPLVFCSTKVLSDPHAGLLVLGRIFSGILSSKSEVLLVNSNTKAKIQNVYVYMGADKKRIDNVPAGNTVAISGIKGIYPGETIVSPSADDLTPFEEIKYLATPVVTIALEPNMLRDLPKLKHLLEKYDVEDPNLLVTVDDKSGEILLMGLGELHLETIVKEISDKIACTASSPLVIIVERIQQASKATKKIMFGSKVELQVIPKKDLESLSKRETYLEEEQRQYNNIILISDSITENFGTESIDNILMGAKEALSKGPVIGKPVYGVAVQINTFETEEGEKFEHTIPLVRNTVWEALKQAKVSVQEPIYRIQITAPAIYLGKVSSVIKKRRGTISDVRSEQDLIIITGYLPVAESFKIDQSLRSETEGRAFWQMSFDRYETVPANQLPHYKKK